MKDKEVKKETTLFEETAKKLKLIDSHAKTTLEINKRKKQILNLLLDQIIKEQEQKP